MRILMTGGGTAGHVNPALAMAAAVRERRPDVSIAFAASDLPWDKAADLVPRAGYELRRLPIRGLRRPLLSPSNLLLPYRLARSRAEALRVIDEIRPDLIVGTGGFACYPVCRAGAARGIPTVLHESNAEPGRAVRMLRNRVSLILTNFAGTAERLSGSRAPVLRVGNPVMPGFGTIPYAEARERLGLAPDDLLLLSFGGSLGASTLNDAVLRLAERLSGADFARVRLLHASGERDGARMEAAWASGAAGACGRMGLTRYIRDMPLRMAAADLVIARAGATTLAELSLLGKAVVLVPSPTAGGGHQVRNAGALAQAGAAVCVAEGDLPGGALEREALRLLGDADARRTMGCRLRKGFACPGAAERICDCLLRAAAGETFR